MLQRVEFAMNESDTCGWVTNDNVGEVARARTILDRPQPTGNVPEWFQIAVRAEAAAQIRGYCPARFG
jgi:hypothetical protein